jgi:outer membrane protein TolC
MFAHVELQPAAAVQPGPADKKDGRLKELLNERLTVLTQLVKASQSGYVTGKVPFERLLEAQRALLHAKLEMCESDKERIALLNDMVALTKEFEKTARARYESGNATQSDVLIARAAHLDAGIALARATAKVAAPRP